MPFAFGYAVKDEPSYNDYLYDTTSDGKVCTGSYSNLLPDGPRVVHPLVSGCDCNLKRPVHWRWPDVTDDDLEIDDAATPFDDAVTTKKVC